MKGMFFAAMVCVIVLCGAAWGDVAINATNFPDAVFRQYVSDNFDTDKNGYLSDEEIKDAVEINAASNEISSLNGIEHFTYLTTLDCSNNKLTELDVGKKHKSSPAVQQSQQADRP